MKPVDNVRTKVLEKFPQASVIERNRHNVKFQLNNGTSKKLLVSAIAPLHYGVGKDLEIDTAWQPDSGAWQYKMVLADYNAYARNVLNAGTLVEYRDPVSNSWITFQPLALNWVNQDDSRQQLALPQPITATVNDDTLVWTDGYGTGRHFSYKTQTGRLAKKLKIDGPANLPAPEPWMTGTVELEIEFIIGYSTEVNAWIDGVEWDKSTKLATANRIEFRNMSTNEVLWYLDLPFATDQVDSTFGRYQIRRQASSYYITARFPKGWVDTAIYPIEIDPSISPQVSASADDAYSADGSGSTNLTGTDHYMGEGLLINDPPRGCGYRWENVTIPQGSVISEAYATFYSRDPGEKVVPVRCYGCMLQNSPVFVVVGHVSEQISPTTAYKDIKETKTYPGSLHARLSDADADLLDSIIQEIVNNATWASGDIVRLVFLGENGDTDYQTLAIRTYDYDTACGAYLYVTYSEAYGTVQSAFRYRYDDGSESGATWIASENTDISIPPNTEGRVRIQINSDGITNPHTIEIEYDKLQSDPDTWEDIWRPMS